MAETAAQVFIAAIARKPSSTIALPTGNTPVGLYDRLIALHRDGRLSCAQARFFNLDEFVGKSARDPQSYAAFLDRHFFHPMHIASGQIRMLAGDATDPSAECRDFERTIAAAGGLDLAILGLGANGHIAFNEPGSDWDSETREITLTPASRRGQIGLFATEAEVPARGLTMGIKTIRQARSILLLVAGGSKREALAALLRQKPDPDWPVTALLDHPALTVVADAALTDARVLTG